MFVSVGGTQWSRGARNERYWFLSNEVRAKVSNSSQKETSNEVNERAEGAREEQAAKTVRRCATKAEAAGTPKRADLSRTKGFVPGEKGSVTF